MPDAVETYGQFGQTLAVAEATLNTILERHLATTTRRPTAGTRSSSSPG